MDYTIRFATENDIDSIMRFINENWKKNHILSKDRVLFEWQYMNNNKVNMVLGLDEKQEIQGVLGYIPYDSSDNKDYALSLWKAKSGTSFLGVKLIMFLMDNEPHRHLFCPGINVNTSAGIYHRLGIGTGKMKQWYRLSNLEDYKIAKIESRNIPKYNGINQLSLVKVSSFEEFKDVVDENFISKSVVPYKSFTYLEKRYFNHPTYEYLVYVVRSEKQKAKSAVVLRVQKYNDSIVLRLIDILGDYSQIAYITQEIDCLLYKLGAEYIDMYEIGLDDELLLSSGWLPVGANENIIPNYFAPYTQCNVDINYCSSDKNIVLFKGDGDQDRPN